MFGIPEPCGNSDEKRRQATKKLLKKFDNLPFQSFEVHIEGGHVNLTSVGRLEEAIHQCRVQGSLGKRSCEHEDVQTRESCS